MSTVDDLRAKIKKRHEQEMERELKSVERLNNAGILNDLEILRPYLSPPNLALNGDSSGASKVIPNAPKVGGGKRAGSMRVRVMNIITQSWASIDEISKSTGIDIKKVRGVVYQPKLKSSLETREINGKKEYRIKPKEGNQ